MPDAFHQLATKDRSSVVLSPSKTDQKECSVCLFFSVGESCPIFACNHLVGASSLEILTSLVR